ncbi:DUF115 domain-containing protein [Paenibacillus vini]|uniref:motility associated factor glycosyltransferase family protein n=1 Tax=Paenibacillus vini TaxID=1476024 RepID=UPI0025B69A9D|nr:6-hydroxymethylpterin diphosphokinase MptE-like protein [Paenibacillus vini]MDN4066443.1 DUF115 domain-containing protein [Paenibacillus vini]
MDYLNSNLKLISEKYSHVYNLLQSQVDMELEKKLVMDNGLGNVVFFPGTSEEFYLYEREDTLFEFASWIQSLEPQFLQHDHVLLFGLGLGYHLRLLLEHYPNKWVYVYEPNINMFITSLKSENFFGLLDHPNVKALAVGSSLEQKRQLIYPICSLAQGSCAFTGIPSYTNQLAREIQCFKDEIPSLVEEYKVNQNTLIQFKDVWMRNRLNHLVTNLITPSLSKMKGVFSGLSAVIVGSGPSLQLDIDSIAKLKDRCFIIAAGSSVQALLHKGVSPHVVVTVDGGDVMENIFLTPESLNIPMIYTPTTNYNVTDKVNALKVHAFTDTDPITNYFMGEEDDTPVFRSLASVTGVSIQAAIYLGCELIIFAGQDFSFPQEKHYSEGVNHIESQHAQATVASASLFVENVNEGWNRTTLPYKVLQKKVEEVISWYPGVRFINTSKIGAKIVGTEWVTIEQLDQILDPSLKSSSESIQNELINVDFSINSLRTKQIVTRLSNISDEFQSVSQGLRDIKNQLRKLPELSRRNPIRCSNSMATIEEMWSSIVNSKSFNILIEPLIPAELQFFDNHLSLIVEEQNIIQKSKYFEMYLGKLVEEIIAAIQKLEALLIDAIHRVNKVLTAEV